LDPSHAYLLQADIREFRQNFATELDDLAKAGDLTAAKEIYDRFRGRALEQIEELLARLEDPEYQFNYGTNATLPIDRDELDWPENEAAADLLWEQTLTLGMLNLELSEQEEEEARDSLIRRYHTQLNNLNQQNARDVAAYYFNSLARLYDPHTDYFSPRESEDFNINMSLSLQGIGAQLVTEDEFTKIVELIPGGPADLNGELGPEDLIVEVGEGTDCDFIDVVGWRLNDVVDRIRGEKGSTIRLKVIPADADIQSEERKIVTLVRDEIKLEEQAAKGEVLEVDTGADQYAIGVIDIPSFYLDFEALRNRDPDYRSTTNDTRRILRDFQEQGVDAVIIDLRGNGGGSLLESATLTDLFVDPGPVVQIRDSANNVYRDQRARGRQEYTGPLMVLIDRLSASASEIFAGAIQDYNRGIVIGSRSFGKGTVQTVMDLPEGQLKLTESKFYRITGESTQHNGVVPDIFLPSFFDEEEIGESSYDNPLAWDEIGGIPHRSYEDYSPYYPQLIAMHEERLSSDPDLIYLKGVISAAEERRQRETISLNLEERQTDRDYWDDLDENLLNEWKLAKGIPLEEPEDEGVDESAEAEETSAAEDALASDESDTSTDAVASSDDEDEEANEPNLSESLLNETANIFADLLDLLYGNQSLANRQNI
ncbi:MAG: carboxy terminal-processing peptidase, partial [Porticoccaceae bacterium]|nr:carboxy terminal-processing peptidase [Porticoccaceae bacterium]